MKTIEYYGHGKFLISGEYLVLEGAKALAIPLNRGQKVMINEIEGHYLYWKAYYPNHLWLETVIDLRTLTVVKGHFPMSTSLIEILEKVRVLNPDFLSTHGADVSTVLDFHPEWGFGSSSSLLYCLGQWANVDAFELQKMTFQGSGFDIACAMVDHPIMYQLIDGQPHYEERTFAPSFSDKLYWVWLGDKQKTFKELMRFKRKGKFTYQDIHRIDEITEEICKPHTQEEFNSLLAEHEQIISRVIRQEAIGEGPLKGFPGQIKSLGAWGGDFILASSTTDHESTIKWFHDHNLTKHFAFNELMIK